jgi:DNA polymerase-4
LIEKYDRTSGLTASAGVSFNKFIAKVASDVNKPDSISVITPEMADEFIDNLPIRKFLGIGKVTEEKMISLGIRTGAELKQLRREKLIELFGKSGSYFYDIAHGMDNGEYSQLPLPLKFLKVPYTRDGQYLW